MADAPHSYKPAANTSAARLEAALAARETATKGSLADLMDFDALAAAEEIYGRRTPEAESLGFALHAAACQRRAALLAECDDTTFNNVLSRYQGILLDLGFEELARYDFVREDAHSRQEDAFFIYARQRDGLLLAYDSYGGNRVNGGHLYYNWEPLPEVLADNVWCSAISSGGFVVDPTGTSSAIVLNDPCIWVGDHDCREGLRRNIARLDRLGHFRPSWVRRPWLSLLGYGEYDRDAAHGDPRSYSVRRTILNLERLAALPEWARAAFDVPDA